MEPQGANNGYMKVRISSNIRTPRQKQRRWEF